MSSLDQAETFVYALLGGVFFGLYPSQIKTPAVIRAAPSPVVFQAYKSAVVFASGFLFLLPRLLSDLPHGQTAAFVFSKWGFLAAFFWIPAGLTTIASVPMVGMGMVVAISSASNAILSFSIETALGINRMKAHACGSSCVFYLAPLWLMTTVLSILVMLFPGKFVALARRYCFQKQKCECDTRYDPVGGDELENGHLDAKSCVAMPEVDKVEVENTTSVRNSYDGNNKDKSEDHILRCPSVEMTSMNISVESASFTDIVIDDCEARQAISGNPGTAVYQYVLGTVLAMIAGTLSVGQFLSITLGRYYEEFKANCSATVGSPFIVRSAGNVYSSESVSPSNNSDNALSEFECPWYIEEQFDKMGSWYASFGIGAALVTVGYLCLYICLRGWMGETNTFPDFHWNILKSAGLKAGVLWTLGNCFTTLAVARGGTAIAMPQVLSFNLIASGGYGILVYGEGENRAERIVWTVGALISLLSTLLLGAEKA